MLGIIFRKAQNKIQDPAKLRRLVAELIDREQWTSLAAADIVEDLQAALEQFAAINADLAARKGAEA